MKIKIKKFIIMLLISVIVVNTIWIYHEKPIECKAALTTTLSLSVLYEVCLYVGGIVITACGAGIAYENRDDIARFGKSVIDNVYIGSEGFTLFQFNSFNGIDGNLALSEIKGLDWSVIQGGGGTDPNGNNNHDLDRAGWAGLTALGALWVKEKVYPWLKEKFGIDDLYNMYSSGLNNLEADDNPIKGVNYTVTAINKTFTVYKEYDFTSYERVGAYKLTSNSGEFYGYYDICNLVTNSITGEVFLSSLNINPVIYTVNGYTPEDDYYKAIRKHFYSNYIYQFSQPGAYVQVQSMSTNVPLFDTKEELLVYLQNGVLDNSQFEVNTDELAKLRLQIKDLQKIIEEVKNAENPTPEIINNIVNNYNYIIEEPDTPIDPIDPGTDYTWSLDSIIALLSKIYTAIIDNSDKLVHGFAQGLDEVLTRLGLREIADNVSKIAEAMPGINPEIEPFKWPEIEPFKWPEIEPFKWPEIEPFKWPEIEPFKWPEIEPFKWPEIETFKWPEIEPFKWPEMIIEFFTIDSVRIKAEYEKIHIPKPAIFDKFTNYYMNLGSAVIEYPKIEVDTPNVLKPFYDQPTIVLLDFADWKEYCIWARRIFAATTYLAFGFAMIYRARPRLGIG